MDYSGRSVRVYVGRRDHSVSEKTAIECRRHSGNLCLPHSLLCLRCIRCPPPKTVEFSNLTTHDCCNIPISLIIGRAESFPQLGAAIFPAIAEFASAKRWFPLRFWRESPPYHLGQSSNLVNLFCFNTTRYYNLPTEGILCFHKLRYSLSGADEPMNLPVMA